MTTNNTTISARDACGYSPAFWNMVDAVDSASWTVSIPMTVFITLPTNLVSFMAFYRQRKQDKAVGYQIYYSISELIVTLAIIFDQCCKFLSGITPSSSASWFTANYILMWLAGHMRLVVFHGSYTWSLLVSAAVAADRVFALAKPFAYKTISQKRHQMAAVACCAIIGYGTSAFDLWRYNIIEKPIGYSLQLNSQYINGPVGNWFVQIRNVTRLIGLIALLVCNAVAVRLYQKRQQKVGQMVSNDAHEHKRKEAEKMLIVISVCEGCFTGVSTLLTIANGFANFVIPGFSTCMGQLTNSLTYIIVEGFKICEFYVAFAISRRFRRMVIKALPTCGSGNRVTTIHTLG